MADRPEDAPLGATPILPPPSGAAAERAEGAFKKYVERLRSGGENPEAPTPATAAAKLPDPDRFTGGRRYDLALSKVDLPPLAQPTATTPSNDSSVADPGVNGPGEAGDSPSDDPQPAGSLPPRPPPGSPFVRPPVSRPAGPEAVSQDLLESAADSAMLRTEPDGTTSFDIAFSDELLSDVACRVTVAGGRVVAIFRVKDDNTRRLLEAEAGRLRVRLEERGLRVEEVRVEVES
jgi:hypothetical protein